MLRIVSGPPIPATLIPQSKVFVPQKIADAQPFYFSFPEPVGRTFPSLVFYMEFRLHRHPSPLPRKISSVTETQTTFSTARNVKMQGLPGPLQGQLTGPRPVMQFIQADMLLGMRPRVSPHRRQRFLILYLCRKDLYRECGRSCWINSRWERYPEDAWGMWFSTNGHGGPE